MIHTLFILLMILYILGIFLTFKTVFNELNYWKWIDGRQKNTKYKKFCLWSFKIWKCGFDAYIIKYERFTMLDWHKDIVNGKHYRLNIKLKGKASFMMRTEDKYIFNRHINPRFVAFRPDLYEHKVFTSEKTIKLSFGFVKFN